MEVAKFVNDLIIMVNQIDGSDIHFKPTRSKVEIYLRTSGKLIHHHTIDLEFYAYVLRYIKYKCNLDLGVSKEPQDGAYSIQTNAGELFARISTIPLIYNESLVIRVLTESVDMTFETIAFIPPQINLIYDTIINNNGLFVFTGPTGSGKSTSMYNILKKAARECNRKIICIEDPSEVIEESLTQIQIKEEVGLTYSVALKACLRHDPDIIMIGEIRDEQTAKSVIRATLTGHTVITTMHTKNNYGVIQRLSDFGFKASEIQSVLIGISNQRLVIDQLGSIKAYYDVVCGDDITQLMEQPQNIDLRKKLVELNIEVSK